MLFRESNNHLRKGTPSIIALHRRLLLELQHFRVAAKEVYDSTIFSEKSGLPEGQKSQRSGHLVKGIFTPVIQSCRAGMCSTLPRFLALQMSPDEVTRTHAHPTETNSVNLNLEIQVVKRRRAKEKPVTD